MKPATKTKVKPKKKKATLAPASPAALKDLPARDRSVLSAIREELRRSMKELRLAGHPRPYLVTHLVKLNHVAEVWGKYGSIFHSREGNHCVVYTEVRVGSY
ncbi:MAG: hypothetical protein HY720_25655, partial [Planctomycetes bacterium]|nr:hypothetical protein [Planctomycetota bacterium]